MINRRQSLAIGLWFNLLHGPVAHAADRVYRLGILRPGYPGASDIGAQYLRAALREQGYVEGQNLTIAERYAQGQFDRLPALALELLEGKPDLLFTVGSTAAKAAKAQTATVSIVMFGNFDPVGQGLARTLARPGGNVTGVLISADGGTLAGKKLELLKQAVPRAARFALLAPEDPSFGLQLEEARKAAAALGVGLQVVVVRQRDFDAAFAALAAERAQAVLVGAHSLFTNDRQPIIDLALRARLPTIWEWPKQVEDGGLMAYGADLQTLYRRVAVGMDRIFKGAPPGDLPIELPAKFELVVNQKTARAIGLALPQSLVLRADRVIE
jgi:putative ABC transport system substrate-binding protein